MSAGIGLDEAAQYLPNLSPALRDRLYDDLKSMASKGFAYYFRYAEQHRLQGDVCASSPVILFRGGTPSFRENSTVLLLSNSCDMDPKNERIRPEAPTVSLAPVMRLSRWKQLLLDAGEDEKRVASVVDSAQKQLLTTIFYLPKGIGIQEDSLALLDQVQSVPTTIYEAFGPTRLASLSQPAYWLLLLKLAMHFCRMHEGVVRYEDEGEKPEAPAKP